MQEIEDQNMNSMSSKLLPQDYELVAIDKLIQHPDNPRKGSVEGIARSIVANGFYRPVVVQKSTCRILAGNHSWEAAKSEGLTKIPVVWLDVDDVAALKILLADNRLNDIAGYDHNALAKVLMDARNQDALAGTGWSEANLGQLFKSMSEVILNAAADTVAEVEEETLIELPGQPVTRRGDIWGLGENRLLCGDATQLGDVHRLMGGAKAVLVFMDPPYNCHYQGYTEEELTIEADHMGAAEYKAFLAAAFRSCAEATTPTASLYVMSPLAVPKRVRKRDGGGRVRGSLPDHLGQEHVRLGIRAVQVSTRTHLLRAPQGRIGPVVRGQIAVDAVGGKEAVGQPAASDDEARGVGAARIGEQQSRGGVGVGFIRGSRIDPDWLRSVAPALPDDGIGSEVLRRDHQEVGSVHGQAGNSARRQGQSLVR